MCSSVQQCAAVCSSVQQCAAVQCWSVLVFKCSSGFAERMRECPPSITITITIPSSPLPPLTTPPDAFSLQEWRRRQNKEENVLVLCYKSPELRLNLSRSWHKVTLVRTIPRSLFKSYTKDLLLPIFGIAMQWYDLGPKAMRTRVTSGSKNVSSLFSMDSGLEAFSRNPTHGSFSALTFQSTEFANYVNQRFLSY